MSRAKLIDWYVGGPMSRHPHLNFPAHLAAAKAIRKQLKATVWSPAEEDIRSGFDPDRDTPDTLEKYMRRDLPAVARCEGIAFLPGWRNSVGSMKEYRAAVDCGLAVREIIWHGKRIELRPLPRESILQEAQRLVHGERGADYGHPSVDFLCSAEILRALVKRRFSLDIPFTDDFIGLIMTCAIKGSREAGKHKRDNCSDGAGYWETVQMCHDRRWTR